LVGIAAAAAVVISVRHLGLLDRLLNLAGI
jgi:hypothetical protein